MDIVFMGTPEFAVPCLERLISDKNNVLAVFTQPDKPKGRGHILTAPPVKIKAMGNNIPVFQPSTLKDGEAFRIMRDISPQVIIVAAYGKILPEQIISLPNFGCICIHASLLPKYRGAAPIQWSLINGEKVTGVTSMQMDSGIDTGDMLLSKQTEIGINENSGELFNRLSYMGADIMSETILSLQTGKITPIRQDNNDSSYAPMLTKALCPINWNEPAQKVHNLIRGLSPFLSATADLEGKIVKIRSSSLVGNCNGKPGEVIENAGKLIVSCGDLKAIEVLTLQAEGKSELTADEFMRGHKILKGTIFK